MPRKNHRPRRHGRRPNPNPAAPPQLEVNDINTERLARRLVLRGLRTVAILDRPINLREAA